MAYLYGSAVQGIQQFIFQTNELKDIVGASELVQYICTDKFMEIPFEDKEKVRAGIVVQAAGNIKCIFENKEDCIKAVLTFPKMVMEAAPGITISQAVVEMKGSFKDAVDELEKRLRTQRNKPANSLTVGLMGIERSRKTGLPAVKWDNGEPVDEGTQKKREKYEILELCNKSFGEGEATSKNVAYNIGDMTWRNDWVAIVHADGNGLGEVVREIGSDADHLKTFSHNLDEATKSAAQAAFQVIKKKYYDDESDKPWGSKRIPLRPVVLSGDDMTIICRADLAVDYTKEFIRNFETATAEKTGHSLTACAGIAFIKSSYPFFYGYKLAETLCDQAKKDSKSEEMRQANGQKILSSIMFHKVQSSFVESYSDIVEKELMTDDGKALFDFGPYYLKSDAKLQNRWSVERLEQSVERLSSEEGNAVKSAVRRWLTAMVNNRGLADQMKKRSQNIISQKDLLDEYDALTTGVQLNRKPRVGNVSGNAETYPAYDVLSLQTINNQETK